MLRITCSIDQTTLETPDTAAQASLLYNCVRSACHLALASLVVN